MDVPQGTGWAKGAWGLNLETSAHRGKYGSLLQSAWFPAGCLNQGIQAGLSSYHIESLRWFWGPWAHYSV